HAIHRPCPREGLDPASSLAERPRHDGPIGQLFHVSLSAPLVQTGFDEGRDAGDHVDERSAYRPHFGIALHLESSRPRAGGAGTIADRDAAASTTAAGTLH